MDVSKVLSLLQEENYNHHYRGKEKKLMLSGENAWIPDYNTNGTVIEEMVYLSSNVTIPTGSVIRKINKTLLVILK